MSFHRNLNGEDLHAPTILLIENNGESSIVIGDVLVVVGYNKLNKRYKVRKGTEIPTIGLNTRAVIYGIANEALVTINDTGRMVAFGVVEGLSVLETPNTSTGMPVAIAQNSPLFIDIGTTSANVGRVVTGLNGVTVEAGIVLEVSGSGIVTAFIFSLTSGLIDFAEKRALKAHIPFNTADTSIWIPNMSNLDLEATIVHNLERIDFVLQFYEYTSQDDPVNLELGSQGGTIDVEWRTDGSNPLNAILVTLPPATQVPHFEGYIEIIY